MSILQQNMLLALHERNYLPLAQFTMSSTQEDEVYAVALAPVYLGTPDDDMQQVKQLGEQLMELSNAGLITLDYDIPIEGYPYQEYNDSALFRFFQDTVKEGSTMHGSLFDTANLELGSMAITELGIARADEMLPH
ncbi:hypothetical protein LJC33_04355 [Eubacteriales bacterium OttesenSCG-928-N13]|nr:hypothetical protein [Eubacteriales bacterium OttesenSCG-928-N13]